MKRALVVTALLLGSVLHAQADYMVFKWHDTIRPNSHKRGDPIADAIIDSCNRKFGEANMRLPPGFKECMAKQGYRFVSSHLVRTRRQPVPVESSYDSSPPEDSGPTPSSATPPDTTPVQPIILDQAPSPDIHPFCADTIC